MLSQNAAPRCKRLSASSSKQERQLHHRLKMAERKARRAARTPGFTPVPNGRVDGAIAAATAAIMLANAERGAPVSHFAAEEQAVREVARSLPAERRVRRWWRKRPTKNADPAYRKAVQTDGERRWLPL